MPAVNQCMRQAAKYSLYCEELEEEEKIGLEKWRREYEVQLTASNE